MVAKVSTLLTMEFIENRDGVYDLAEINGVFTSIEFVFNTIIDKFGERGFFMEQMELEKATTMSGVMSAMNNNVDKINQYMSALNTSLATNYMLDKEVLSVMSIDVVNRDGAATVEVHPLKINIGLNNGQTIEVNTTSVVSELDGDTQTIVHA